MEAKHTTRVGRRAMLAAAVGGVAAAAGALAAPGRVLGADGDPLLIGRSNSAINSTWIRQWGESGFRVLSESGSAVLGSTGARSGSAAVHGIAETIGGLGVVGESAGGGTGRLGTRIAGVQALQGDAPLALDVQGKARFSRSGVATIPAGRRFVQVAVDGLTASSFALAALQQYRANLWVQSITVSASSASIYVYVSQRAPQATRVAWMVFDNWESVDF